MELQTVIDKYDVDLDTDMDGVGVDHPHRVSGCWINYKQFMGSLERLLGSGELWDDHGVGHVVEQSVIDEIEEWAVSHGY